MVVKSFKEEVRYGTIRIFAVMLIASPPSRWWWPRRCPIRSQRRAYRKTERHRHTRIRVHSELRNDSLFDRYSSVTDTIIEANTRVIAETCRAMEQVQSAINHRRRSNE